MLQEKIAIVGVLPPPFGGVSVSLQRLIRYLDQSDLEFVIYNTGKKPHKHSRVVNVGWSIIFFLKLLFFSKHELIHFNTSRWWIRLYASLLATFSDSKIIFGARGYSIVRSVQAKSFILSKLSLFAIKKASCIVTTNDDIKRCLQEFGVKSCRIQTIPPFIPPGTPKFNKVSEKVMKFCLNKRPVLGANGAFTLINNEDVYGFNAMIELIKFLKNDFPDIALVVYLRKDSEGNRPKFKNILEKINRYDLKDHVLIFSCEEEFYHFYTICDIFLRPTSTDGDANSIREALYFGIPVVASNAAPRLSNCYLYKYGKQNELNEVTKQLLLNLASCRKTLKSLNSNNAVKIINLYKKIINTCYSDS